MAARRKTAARPIKAPAEDLNLNNIVSRQFDRAARFVALPDGLLQQIKVCNNVVQVQFPVKIGDKFVIFQVGAPSTATTASR